MKRHAPLAICVLLMGNVIALQGQTRKDAETVGWLCGKLLHLDSREKVDGGFLEHTSPIPNVLISGAGTARRTAGPSTRQLIGQANQLTWSG